MKTNLLTLTCLFTAFLLLSCDHDGNTGNGANDPTDKFESGKVMKSGDNEGGAANESGNANGNPASGNQNANQATDSVGPQQQQNK